MGVIGCVGVGVGVGVGVAGCVGVGGISSVQIINVAPDRVPPSLEEKSSIYNFQVPLDDNGCNPSNVVNSGELPVVNCTGQGAENAMEFPTELLFLNVPELYPFQVVGE